MCRLALVCFLFFFLTVSFLWLFIPYQERNICYRFAFCCKFMHRAPSLSPSQGAISTRGMCDAAQVACSWVCLSSLVFSKHIFTVMVPPISQKFTHKGILCHLLCGCADCLILSFLQSDNVTRLPQNFSIHHPRFTAAAGVLCDQCCWNNKKVALTDGWLTAIPASRVAKTRWRSPLSRSFGMSWLMQQSSAWPATVGAPFSKLESDDNSARNKSKVAADSLGCVVSQQRVDSANALSSGEAENCQEPGPNWNPVWTLEPEKRSCATEPSELFSHVDGEHRDATAQHTEGKYFQLFVSWSLIFNSPSGETNTLLLRLCIFTWFYILICFYVINPNSPRAEEQDTIIKTPPLFTVEHKISDF